MFKRSVSKDRMKVLFVDERNDLQSQVAEYFVKEMFGDMYDVYSAGPTCDYVDCELISVMYQLTYDIRMGTSKDFNNKELPESFDAISYLEKATYDRIKDIVPWKTPKCLHDFGRKENFEDATDDVQSYECYKRLIESVKAWVEENFDDPAKVRSMVA